MTKKIILITGVFALLIIIGFFGFKFLFEEGEADIDQALNAGVLVNRGPDVATPLLEQARTYQRAFDRMVSVGFNAASITHGQTSSYDLIEGRHRVTTRQDVPEESLADPKSGWALGGGQIIGAFQADNPDIVMYVHGVTKLACQQINNNLWGDSIRDDPSLTGSTLANWRDKTVNILQIFNGKSRPHGCVQVRGNYLFYYLMHQS